jgi:hypothetical protein
VGGHLTAHSHFVAAQKQCPLWVSNGQSRISSGTSSMPLVQLIAHVDPPVSWLKWLRRGTSLNVSAWSRERNTAKCAVRRRPIDCQWEALGEARQPHRPSLTICRTWTCGGGDVGFGRGGGPGGGPGGLGILVIGADFGDVLPWFESARSTGLFASTIASASHRIEVSMQRPRIGRSGVAGETLTSNTPCFHSKPMRYPR